MPSALNAALAAAHPAAAALLSDAGRRAKYPSDITAQAADARGCELRATIGQFTRGDGTAFTPPALADHVTGLQRERTFLYGPVGGHGSLRQAWQTRLQKRAPLDLSLPVVTSGITNALSLVADLFVDEQTHVIYAAPFWGNYRLVFGLKHRGRLRTFPFFRDGRFNTEGLADTLKAVEGERAVLILNFPGNPTGFSPAEEDVAAIVDVVADHAGPLAVVCDDAYKGMVFERGVLAESMANQLALRMDPERHLLMTADGCTKELMFFGGRVGFLTFWTDKVASAVLEEKARTFQRSSINIPNGPAQELALAALNNGSLDQQLASIFDILAARYATLQRELATLGPPLRPYPFNSGFFALVGVDRALDADELRRRLIADYSVGLIAIPSVNALRIAFCSIDSNNLVELVRRVRIAAGA